MGKRMTTIWMTINKLKMEKMTKWTMDRNLMEMSLKMEMR